MHRPAIATFALLLAAGCAYQAPPVDPALQQRAVAAITDTFAAPRTITVQQAWVGQNGQAMGLVCGRIDAPAMLAPRSSLRFIYEDHSHHGQVELHELILADTRAGEIITAENRRLFDQLWETSCAPVDPAHSWMATIFG